MHQWSQINEAGDHGDEGLHPRPGFGSVEGGGFQFEDGLAESRQNDVDETEVEKVRGGMPKGQIAKDGIQVGTHVAQDAVRRLTRADGRDENESERSFDEADTFARARAYR